MKEILNTLYIMTQGAYVHLDHETLLVKVEGEIKLRALLHHLGAIVCFVDVLMTPALMGRCAEDGRSIVFLSQSGRFKARVEGLVSGNVLLRCTQHRVSDAQTLSTGIARNIVASKVRKNLLPTAG